MKTVQSSTGTTERTADATTIRSFEVDVSEEALEDLRRRIAATQWPEQETVADQSQGVQLTTIKKLARYWETEYDWRDCEARLNALPQFTTEIDGLDIHFIHVRSQYEDALPFVVNHGWPGSVVEQLKIIEPLAYPNLIYFNEVERGGHFAAWEEPELFSAEVRAAFRSLRTNGGTHE